MTNEEAIRILTLERDDWETSHCTPMRRKEAFGMAINALTKEAWKEEHPVSPLLQKLATDMQPCKQDDTISRSAAIDALKEHRNLFCDNTPDTFSVLPYGDKCRVDELDMVIATLINLPSVQPQRTGRWIDGKCNRCGTHAPYWSMASTYYLSGYCPQCGARMEENNESD